MKTFLVNPDAKFYRNIPPLALAYMATLLNLKVIDQNTKPYPKDRFLEKEADILGVFVRSTTLLESKRIKEIYEKRFPNAKIKSLNTPIDVQCCYPTIQLNEQIKFNKIFGDSYLFPDFSLFDSYDVFLQNWQTGSWPYGILTSVGCPFQCVYCAARNRKWLFRSPKNCVEELKKAKDKYGIVSFEILDDAFNVDKKRVLEFCKLVKSLNLRWICANGLRADLFDEEQAEAMSVAGCDSVSFGVESVNVDILRKIKKGETIEQISKAIDIAKRYFENVNGFFIIGLPGSTYKKDLKSVEWMVKKGITGVFSYYVPYGNSGFFYGDSAEPKSNEYPNQQQKEIYKMVEFMSGSTTIGNIIPRVFNTTRLVWNFDKQHFFFHLWNNLNKLGFHLPGVLRPPGR